MGRCVLGCRHMASHRTLAAVLATVAIVVAACGGGSSTSATKMAADPARDQRTARTLFLVDGDFPSGGEGGPACCWGSSTRAGRSIRRSSARSSPRPGTAWTPHDMTAVDDPTGYGIGHGTYEDAQAMVGTHTEKRVGEADVCWGMIKHY